MGCKSTPETSPSFARFDSSEVNSQPFHFKLGIGSDTKNVINIDETKESFKESSLRLSAAMTLGNGVEARFAMGEDADVGLKYQFYGAPLEEKLIGNISLATSLGYSQDEQDLRSGSDLREGYDIKYRHVDIALIAGYRVSSDVLLYGSVFLQKGDIEGNYKLTEYYDGLNEVLLNEGCDISRTCLTAGISDDGHGYGANLALEYEVWRWFVVTGEVVYHRANWFDRANAETAGNINLEFRF